MCSCLVRQYGLLGRQEYASGKLLYKCFGRRLEAWSCCRGAVVDGGVQKKRKNGKSEKTRGSLKQKPLVFCWSFPSFLFEASTRCFWGFPRLVFLRLPLVFFSRIHFFGWGHVARAGHTDVPGHNTQPRRGFITKIYLCQCIAAAKPKYTNSKA